MAQPSFWLVMDQDGDGMAESVLPSHAKTEQLAIVEGLEHHEGRLIEWFQVSGQSSLMSFASSVLRHQSSPRAEPNHWPSESITMVLLLIGGPSC